MSETITFLEMTDPAELREPSSPPRVEFSMRQVHDPAINRDLYAEIGGPHKWVDRLRWNDKQWAAWAHFGGAVSILAFFSGWLALLAILPALIIFLVCQDQIYSGLAAGAVKG